MCSSAGDQMSLGGDARVGPVAQQGVVAQAREAEPRHRAEPAALVGRLRRAARVGLKPRRQRVAHAGHEETRRRVGDDLRIDEHDRRIRLLVVNGFEHAGLRGEHRAATARRIGRGDGRHDDHRDARAVGGDFCGVDGLAAAHAHEHVGVVHGDGGRQARDLLFAALAAEADDGQLGQLGQRAGAGENPFRRRGGEHEPARSVLGDQLGQLGEGVDALQILTWELNPVEHALLHAPRVASPQGPSAARARRRHWRGRIVRVAVRAGVRVYPRIARMNRCAGAPFG